jgi:hypothetical protein
MGAPGRIAALEMLRAGTRRSRVPRAPRIGRRIA